MVVRHYNGKCKSADSSAEGVVTDLQQQLNNIRDNLGGRAIGWTSHIATPKFHKNNPADAAWTSTARYSYRAVEPNIVKSWSRS